MFPGIANARIFLCRLPTDMRRSYDTLAAMAETELGEEPTSGALFVFLNRQRNRVKILYFETGGFCIWMNYLSSYYISFGCNV